jgi:hypothetical protein
MSSVDITNCQEFSILIPPKEYWKCPDCGSPPVKDLVVRDGGSVLCPNCTKKFHWCPIDGKEVSPSPIHNGKYVQENYNCIYKEVDNRPQKADWRCPSCKSPGNMKIFPMDGGSVMCTGENCVSHFHWCSDKLCEVEGSPMHSVVVRKV